METAPQLPRKPVARTEKVEDLVAMVRRGLVRVPTFQRGLNWKARNVQELFDSVYRGYPIGSLLFYLREGPASSLDVGPLRVDAAEEPRAWWVVDGQQRLTALTACLARPLPLPTTPDDPYVLYFDVRDSVFRAPPRDGRVPDTWVPLPILLDASELTEWAFGWEHGQDRGMRERVFDAGSRIREYPIPLYLIETEDEEAAKQIFYRTNTAGKPLAWPDVYKALFGDQSSSPSNLSDLAEELAEVGMGRLKEDRLLTALLGLRGLDPTRSLQEHYHRDPAALRDAVRDGLPVLRRVLSFLRQDAEVPHLRLLPKPVLLDVLTRFFALHPGPAPRTRTLLARWFWRTVLGGGAYDDRTLRRRGIRAIEAKDEEGSMQALLDLVNVSHHRQADLPDRWDGRSDATRIVLATLAHLGPRHLESGQPLDVAGLLERQDDRAFVKIVEAGGVEGGGGPQNRILHPKGFQVAKLLAGGSLFDSPEIAASHAVSTEALERLETARPEEFLAARAETLTREVRRFADRMAAWEQNDRPSIEFILAEAGAELEPEATAP